MWGLLFKLCNMIDRFCLFPVEERKSHIKKVYCRGRHTLDVGEFPETVKGDLFFRQEREFKPEIDRFEIIGILAG